MAPEPRRRAARTLRLEEREEISRGIAAGRSMRRVAQKLALQWSPEQISGWLKRQLAADQGMQISHETIYRSLFIQTRGVLKKQLMAHLRTARQLRIVAS
jgi:IS30 family transposase